MAETTAPDPELAEHPGRPRGRDEVDPDLLILPRPRARIGWLLALSVVVFCAYFIIRLSGDLAFSRQGEADRMNDPKAAMSAAPNSFVAVRAVPDRASILRVSASDAIDGHRLAPVLGTADGLWIMIHGSHWSETPTYDEVVRGRVARLGDLPFYDELRNHLRAMTAMPRGVDAAELARAVASGGGATSDVSGDPLHPSPTTPVVVAQRVAGQARITGFRTEGQQDEEAWRVALEKASVLPPGTALAASTKDTWTFEVAAPDGVDALAARLVDAKLLAARVEPVDRLHETTWADLAVEGDDLLIPLDGAKPPPRQLPVPLAEITSVTVAVPRDAPPDARVIIATEEPGQFWYVLPLTIAFAGFGLLFAWALWRALRAPKVEARAP